VRVRLQRPQAGLWIEYRTISPKRPGPHQQSRQANILRLAALFFGSPVRHAWMNASYLIAVAIAMAGWLFLIVWIVGRLV
jgi:hypothetical protein